MNNNRTENTTELKNDDHSERKTQLRALAKKLALKSGVKGGWGESASNSSYHY